MAFWGIGKLKQYGGMLNLKEVGSKLKTYVNQPQQQPSPLLGANKSSRTTEELLEIQLIEYQKLVDLEKEILAEIQDQKKREFEEKQKALLQKLNHMQYQRQQQKKEEAVMELTRQVESGQKNLRSIMMENTLLREQVSKNKIDQTS